MTPISIQKFTDSSEQRQLLQELAREWEGKADFWSSESILSSLSLPETMMWYAVRHGSELWAGMILMRAMDDEAELLYIHTASSHRGQGVGKRLFQDAVKDLGQATKKIFLEVRPSNHSALALYHSLGFQKAGIRKQYYKDGEDALVFEIAVP